MNRVSYAEARALLKQGRIGVLPTDTLYGLVASALDSEAVSRVYSVRGRDERKPCIVLIADVDELDEFGIDRSEAAESLLRQAWPGKVSVVLPCRDDRWTYLHRGTKTIAFRLPDNDDLRVLLRVTGPIIAPSANPAGMPPARTIVEAETYFGDDVDFYVDGGYVEGDPSTVASIEAGKWNVLRGGAVSL